MEFAGIPLRDLLLFITGVAGVYPAAVVMRRFQAHEEAPAKESPPPSAIDFLPDADEIERSPLPWPARTTLYIVVTTMIAFLLWANFSTVDQVVSARGRLVNPLPNIVVQPLETSIVQSIDVRIGQVVKKGERLATLDPTFTQADEGELRNRFQSLDAQAKLLEAEIAGNKAELLKRPGPEAPLMARLAAERSANFRAQLLKMDETLGRLRAAMETNRRDQTAQEARIKSLKEIEGMQERLVAEKIGARVHYLEAQERRLEAERSLTMSRNRDVELRSELAAAAAERAAFEKGWRQKTLEDLLATTRERDSVREQLQKADRRNTLVTLTSPADAVVLDIAKRSQGSVVQSAEQLFTLVPLGSELEAEVQITSQDVGYVKLKDATTLKFDAFPFQKHGTANGEVRTISEDAFRHESGANTDVYYVSRIHFGELNLQKMPEQAKLLPGMTLTAEIVVGKRSVISYLFWPLTKALDEAIREP